MKKYICLLLFCYSSLYSISQKYDKRYRKETKVFLYFIRDSILSNTDTTNVPRREGTFNIDTVYVRNYLYNKRLFLFTGVYPYSNNLKNGWFTQREKEQIVDKAFNDSSKFIFGNNFISRARVIPEGGFINRKAEFKFVQLSKPIFLRKYTLCVFSYAIHGIYYTILCIKENNKWSLLKILGRINTSLD